MNKRASGILLPVFSLPSPHGIGDFGHGAYHFANFCIETKQTYWQVLPLNPGIAESGYSPYFSPSAFAGNPLLISLTELVKDGYLDKDDLGLVPAFPTNTIDYPQVEAFKLPLLDKAFQLFKKGKNKDTFDTFCEAHSWWLDDYVLFMALKTKYSNDHWNQWPQEIKMRDGAALEQAKSELADECFRHRFYQFLVISQWHALRDYCNSKGLKIIGDIPIYVNYDSADVWANPEIFKLDENRKPTVVSGVPPDYFSATGQLWNNPVYRWDVLEKTNFDWWKKRMRATFERFDIVRIDHFRGLVQFWEVPAGEETAINGVWCYVPTKKFFDSLLKEFPGFPVIAEDLGIITDDVREWMDHYKFPGMKVMLFAFNDNDKDHPYLPHTYKKNFLVYTGTHDNTTIRGWLEQEADKKAKKRFFTYVKGTEDDPLEASRTLIKLGFKSKANTAITPVQDLLFLDGSARINDPSRIKPNWQWRMAEDQFNALPGQWLEKITKKYNRAPEE